MEGKQKKLRIVIGILAVLLLISLGVLAQTILEQRKAASVPTSVSVEENIITSENEASEEDIENEEESEEISETEESQALETSAKQKKSGNSSGNTVSQSASGTSSNKTAENTVALTLKKHHAEENEPFHASNLFPGDRVEKDYRVEVSYKKAVTVHFRIDIQKGYEKLAEVMKCQVIAGNNGKVLYDGLMKDVPKIDRYLTTGSQATEDLKYTIKAYLDTSVGNEYQNKELKADFYWWVEGEDAKNLTTSQGAFGTFGTTTGDTAWTGLWLVIAICAAAGILLLWKKQKKEDNHRA